MAARPVFVHCPLPVAPDRAFDLLTQADQLTLWLCDEATSEVREGGKVRARWHDQDETVERWAKWVQIVPSQLAVLEWATGGAEVGEAGSEEAGSEAPGAEEGAAPEQRALDFLRFDIRAAQGGCLVTVTSPCPVGFDGAPAQSLQDATRHGWQQCFQELGELLLKEKAAGLEASGDSSKGEAESEATL